MEKQDPQKVRRTVQTSKDHDKVSVVYVRFRREIVDDDVPVPYTYFEKEWSRRYVADLARTTVGDVDYLEDVLNFSGRYVAWFERDQNVSSLMTFVVVDSEALLSRVMRLVTLFVRFVNRLARYAVYNKHLRKLIIDTIREYVKECESNVIGEDYGDDVTSALISFRTRMLDLVKLVTALVHNYRRRIPIIDVTRAKNIIYDSSIDLMNNILATEETTQQ